MRKVAIRTVDTDVVVLAVASFNNINPDELWIALGTGSSFRYIAVHQLAAAINPKQCATLPIFHALTGCARHCVFIRWQKEEDCLGDLESVPRGD